MQHTNKLPQCRYSQSHPNLVPVNSSSPNTRFTQNCKVYLPVLHPSTSKFAQVCLVTPPFIQLYRPGILQVQCTLSTQVQGPSLPLVLVSLWHPPRFAEGPIWLTSVPTALCTIWPSSNLQPGFKWHTWETFHIGCYHLGCSILGVAPSLHHMSLTGSDFCHPQFPRLGQY